MKLQTSSIARGAACLMLGVLTGCAAEPLGPMSHARAPMVPGYQVQGLASRYVIAFSGDSLPANAASLVKAAGGTMDATLGAMGVAVATSRQSDFASTLGAQSGVEAVAPLVNRPLVRAVAAASFDLGVDGLDPSGPSGEPLSGYQWGLGLVQAEAAWKHGFTGKGVRVAILDTGIDPSNADLAPGLDRARSISFVPSEPSIVDYHGHGSHVAGLVAAAQNGYGISGVAPEASYFAVKVLDGTGYGDDAGILAGIRYAADQGARVINLSLESLTADRALSRAYAHAVRYAAARGAVVVAAAGNEGSSAQSLGALLLPAELEQCVTVSAVGPQNQQNFTGFALYSNFGQFVDLAAPGGGIGFDPATMTPIIYNKRDLVLSTWSTRALKRTEGGIAFGPATHMFMVGTSQAAPHVSGALALLFQAHPDFTVSQAKHWLAWSAQDLGKPGEDSYYGKGLVDAGAF